MNIRFEPNKISFDEAGFRNEILTYVRGELDLFEKEYLDVMGDIIRKFPHTKEYFRQVVAASLEHIKEDLVGGVLTYVAGFNEDEADPFDLMKAYVIARGMGSEGINNTPVYAGPNGRLVYGDYLDEYHPSKIQGDGYTLPESWNHPGIDFVAETNARVKSAFFAMLRRICSDLPLDIVSKHIRVG